MIRPNTLTPTKCWYTKYKVRNICRFYEFQRYTQSTRACNRIPILRYIVYISLCEMFVRLTTHKRTHMCVNTTITLLLSFAWEPSAQHSTAHSNTLERKHTNINSRFKMNNTQATDIICWTRHTATDRETSTVHVWATVAQHI